MSAPRNDAITVYSVSRLRLATKRYSTYWDLSLWDFVGSFFAEKGVACFLGGNDL